MGTVDELASDGWQKKGATLSHKTARQEFGVTQEQIVAGFREGQLHCQQVAAIEGRRANLGG